MQTTRLSSDRIAMTMEPFIFIAVPVAQRDDSSIMCDHGARIVCPSADDAVMVAERLATLPGYTASIALSMEYDDLTDRYGVAQVLHRFGSFRPSPNLQFVWLG
jgi:hypothetical protein